MMTCQHGSVAASANLREGLSAPVSKPDGYEHSTQVLLSEVNIVHDEMRFIDYVRVIKNEISIEDLQKKVRLSSFLLGKRTFAFLYVTGISGRREKQPTSSATEVANQS